MNVLLVNTNRIRPPVAPLALDFLGASLAEDGHGVRVLDLCLAPETEPAVERAFRAGDVDLAALTFRNTDDCFLASGRSFVPVLCGDVARIRRCYDGPLVIGGCGFSLMPVGLLEATGEPLGVTGDGEPALRVLTRVLSGAGALSDVPGLVFRQNGTWRRNPPARTVDAWPATVSRNTVDNETYFRRGGQIGVETKRGCPGECVFCADPVIKGTRSRLRAPSDVGREVRGLVARGIDCLHLCDSEFNLPADHALAVCEALAQPDLRGRVRWYTYASPSPFDEAMAAAMVRAGCVGINFGVDSGCDEQLARLGRSFRSDAIADVARICRKHGIVFMYDLLLGGPGETPETLRRTIEFMKAVGPDRVGVSFGVRIYPGTRLASLLDGGCLPPEGIRGTSGGVDPVFFVSPALGPRPLDLLREWIDGDERFFLPSGGDLLDYNYNDNRVLEEAIDRGRRGAYWDILRRLAEEGRVAATAGDRRGEHSCVGRGE